MPERAGQNTFPNSSLAFTWTMENLPAPTEEALSRAPAGKLPGTSVQAHLSCLQGQWEGRTHCRYRLPFSFLIAIISVMMTAAQPQSEAKEKRTLGREEEGNSRGAPAGFKKNAVRSLGS